MKSILLPLGTLLTVLATGTASASDICEVPKAQWQPIVNLQSMLVEQGWNVKKIKVDDGCYEAYAITDNGEKVEAYFNPKTFELVKTK